MSPFAPVSLTGMKSPTLRSIEGLAPVFPTGLTIAWSYFTPPPFMLS